MSATLFPGLKRKHNEKNLTDVEFSWFRPDDGYEKKNNQDNTEYCNCKISEVQTGDLNVCKLCGDIVERSLDLGAEFRFYGAEDRSSVDPCRVGAPVDKRFPSSTLGTIILTKAVGGNSSASKAMCRIRRYHTWNMIPYKERSLLQVFERFALTATNYGINGRAIDLAKELYIQLVEHCDRRGMSKTCVVSSSIYAALKLTGEPRKPKEIADMFYLTTAQFTKAYKYFQEVLAMAKQRCLISDTLAPANAPSTRASDYITYPLSKLPISRTVYLDIQTATIRVANLAEDKMISPENMPPSLAAASLAFVLARSNYADIALSLISTTCNVSEGTVFKCLKRLEQSENILWTK